MTDISIIIPFLNEEDNIGRLSAGLSEFVATRPDIGFEIILVNDGSTDQSIKVITQSNFPANTKLINLSQNYGSHAALRAGIKNATGKYITFMYADLQDPLTLITELYSNCQNGFDIAWASRNETAAGFSEKVFSQSYAKLMQRFVNPKFPEKGFDIVMFNQKVQHELNINIEANSSIFLQILNLGFKQVSIFYQKQLRTAGKSKWTFSKKVKLLVDSFVAFSYVPIRFVTYIGLLFFIIGIIWTVYIVVRKLVSNDLVSGWPMLASILLVGFGITNISLGIIAEYLWRTLDASRKRPVFIISDIIEVKGN